MQRRHFALHTCAALLAGSLAACGEKAAQAASPSPAAASATSSTSTSSSGKLSAKEAYELAAQGNGFGVGPIMAANVVYVFFDTTCPHCAHLWAAAKPLQGKLRVVWMPVGFLRPQSMTQGATILSALDPASAMNENEARLAARLGGIAVNPNLSEEALNKVKANTTLFNKFGAESVPMILWRNARTGEYGVQTGAADTAQLVAMVGL